MDQILCCLCYARRTLHAMCSIIRNEVDRLRVCPGRSCMCCMFCIYLFLLAANRNGNKDEVRVVAEAEALHCTQCQCALINYKRISDAIYMQRGRQRLPLPTTSGLLAPQLILPFSFHFFRFVHSSARNRLL